MFLTTFCGLVFGFCTKMIINWLSIEGYKIKIRNIFPEITSLALCYWAFSSLPTSEAIIFGLIVNVLIGISLIDYNTMQIPIVFILEDYSSNQCYATASYLGIEGGKITDKWTKVTIPLPTFSYSQHNIDLSNIKLY